MHFSLGEAFPVASAALITILVVLLTPLRHLPLIEPTVNDINAAEFQSKLSQTPDQYIFIDVRPESAYANLHAKGSINIPLHMLYDERHYLPKRGKEVILICGGGRASGVGYSYLEHFGFFNLRRIEGGIEEWVASGLPIEGDGILKGSTY